jgi:hypothetical protein
MEMIEESNLGRLGGNAEVLILDFLSLAWKEMKVTGVAIFCGHDAARRPASRKRRGSQPTIHRLDAAPEHLQRVIHSAS